MKTEDLSVQLNLSYLNYLPALRKNIFYLVHISTCKTTHCIKQKQRECLQEQNQ